MKPDLTEFHELSELEALRSANHDLERKLRGAKAKTTELVEAVYQASKDAAVILGNPPPVPKPKADRRKGEAEVGLLHVSDWQTGKDTVSYNTEVAGERVRTLAQKVVRLTEIERADHPVRECHVMLGGDMVEGVAIFPGQPFEVDSSLFTQVLAAAGSINELLRTLLGTFQTVAVWEEPGNHGRLGRRGDMSRQDNADMLVYRLARERLRKFETAGRLVWNESQGWHSIVTVGEYRALLVHGDEIRSFGGNVPAFAISKKVNAWASGVVEPFTDAYMGHWHQPIVLPLANGRGRVFVNPSLESDNIYAAEFVGASGTPGQRLNFINPAKGRVTSERVIWLDQ